MIVLFISQFKNKRLSLNWQQKINYFFLNSVERNICLLFLNGNNYLYEGQTKLCVANKSQNHAKVLIVYYTTRVVNGILRMKIVVRKLQNSTGFCQRIILQVRNCFTTQVRYDFFPAITLLGNFVNMNNCNCQTGSVFFAKCEL